MNLLPANVNKTAGLNVKNFFRASKPSVTINWSRPEQKQYYIDFFSVRGSNTIEELKRTITFLEDEPTCQLFAGHVGCGKSTELSRLKKELEDEGYHVVYFESSQDLDMADVDISDILLAIARQVSKSLEETAINLHPTRFQKFLQNIADNLNNLEVIGVNVQAPETQIFGVGVKLPKPIGFNSENGKFSLSLGIGEITSKSKDSYSIRSFLRDYTEPQVNYLLKAINDELLTPAQEQLKQQGKAGLVVIIDNLDRIDNRQRASGKTQPEYLFIERGEQLNQLKCHVVYTIPLILAFSNGREHLKNRFGSDPKILPMVRVKERDGSPCKLGIDLLQQMVLARAFPDIEPEQRYNFTFELFDNPATLDRLCQVSGGHVRNLLVLLHTCLQKSNPPFSDELIEQVISQRCSDLSNAITPDEWELLREVERHKVVRGEEKCEILLRSLFVFEYRDSSRSWFDINPVLAESEELSCSNEH